MSLDHLMGGCSCGRVRYRLTDTPLIVHACHCRMCQRLSGGAYAVNLVIEAAKITHLTGETLEVVALTPSGHGQVITRCAACHVAVWSEYKIMTAVTGAPLRFVRAGALDDPSRVPPDVHIYAETMQPHVSPRAETPVFPAFYGIKNTWSPASLKRLGLAKAQRSSNESALLREM